jgi:hypothetical protein
MSRTNAMITEISPPEICERAKICYWDILILTQVHIEDAAHSDGTEYSNSSIETRPKVALRHCSECKL